MPVEDRKDTIAFIICVNNELYFEECRYYIEHLEVSAGYDIDVIGIWEADSMCAAYNLGMRSSDAKYKVYMHQDVFIRDSRFLEKTLRIFKEHPKTGMIGMAGGCLLYTSLPDCRKTKREGKQTACIVRSAVIERKVGYELF